MDASLAYVKFISQDRTQSYLNAFTDVEPERGDPMADYMGYFGFGSGTNQGQSPVWLEDIEMFPAAESSAKNSQHPEDLFLGHGQHIISIVEDCLQAGYIFTAGDIHRYLKCARVLTGSGWGGDELNEHLWTLTHSILTRVYKGKHEDARITYPDAQIAYATIALVLKPKSENIKVMFGVNQDVARATERPSLNVNNLADWKYYTQVGSNNHAVKIMRTMGRHSFSSLSSLELNRMANLVEEILHL